MKYLLDTHTFIWFVEDNRLLSQNAKALIENGTNSIYLSLASIWEIAIKVNLGKLKFAQPFDQFIQNQIHVNHILLFDISLRHTLKVADLPLHHRDPFDRLIIAQALVDGIPILGNDTAFDAYNVTRIW